MKNRIFFLLIILFPILGFTQNDVDANKSNDTNLSSKKEPFQTNVMFGIRGGLNISNLDFDATPVMDNKHRNSIYFGAFADISLSNTISLVPEIQFSSEGAKNEKLHLDYIQAPIFLKFRLTPRLRFGIAPQIGWKVHKLNDGVKDLAFSGVTGLEYKINEMLFVDVRYTYGITNIFHESLGIEAKNTNIQIGVGYQF
jgi:hypothetical protein